MTPPNRRRPANTSGLPRGRLAANPEQLHVGDRESPESQTPEPPESGSPEPPKKTGWSLGNRIAQMAMGDQPAAESPSPGTPGPPDSRTPRHPNPVTPAVPDYRTPQQPNSGSHGVPDSQSPWFGPESQAPEPPKSRTPELPTPQTSPTEAHVPRYLTLVRQEARLREDQVKNLGELRRRVAANRTIKAERITDNTLIRLAVDYLIANAGQLHGNTEDELRASLLGDEVTD